MGGQPQEMPARPTVASGHCPGGREAETQLWLRLSQTIFLFLYPSSAPSSGSLASPVREMW